jgi:hypothetical protein
MVFITVPFNLISAVSQWQNFMCFVRLVLIHTACTERFLVLLTVESEIIIVM